MLGIELSDSCLTVADHDAGEGFARLVLVIVVMLDGVAVSEPERGHLGAVLEAVEADADIVELRAG